MNDLLPEEVFCVSVAGVKGFLNSDAVISLAEGESLVCKLPSGVVCGVVKCSYAVVEADKKEE